MKKTWIVVVNVGLIAAILTFVAFFANYEWKERIRHQMEAFEDTSDAMEQVTENYLEGEQQICDVWARYINNRHLTIEEATDFIRSSHVLPNASAHILYVDSLVGLSTRTRLGEGNSYDVSYAHLGLLENVDWIQEVGQAVNVTRAYTNPANGEQCLAFCNRIKLWDTADRSRDALLLRVIPVSELEKKWVFPNESYENAEFSIIDSEGNYIIKGTHLKIPTSLNSINPTTEANLPASRRCLKRSSPATVPSSCWIPGGRSVWSIIPPFSLPAAGCCSATTRQRNSAP